MLGYAPYMGMFFFIVWFGNLIPSFYPTPYSLDNFVFVENLPDDNQTRPEKSWLSLNYGTFVK